MSPQEALRMFRSECGLTQNELADRLKIGLTTFNRWENGKAFPNRVNASNIIAAAEKLSASKDCLRYLNDTLLPTRRRGRSAFELGYPDLDQELLCRVLDSSPTAILIMDERTKQLIYVNRKAEEIAGERFIDANDKHCWSYIMRRDKPCVDCISPRCLESEYYEEVLSMQDGKEYLTKMKSILWNRKRVHVFYMTYIG